MIRRERGASKRKITGTEMSEWLYQIRIKTSEVLSADLRGARTMALSQAVLKIAQQNGMQLVCTFDAFRAYCE